VGSKSKKKRKHFSFNSVGVPMRLTSLFGVGGRPLLRPKRGSMLSALPHRVRFYMPPPPQPPRRKPLSEKQLRAKKEKKLLRKSAKEEEKQIAADFYKAHEEKEDQQSPKVQPSMDATQLVTSPVRKEAGGLFDRDQQLCEARDALAKRHKDKPATGGRLQRPSFKSGVEQVSLLTP